jgi:AraC-like DNA-binding protein
MTISSTHIERADIQFQQAADALKPFTGCFWTVTAERGATIRIVPDGTAAIGVEMSEGAVAQWRLRGPALRPAERRFTAPTRLVGVRLRPGVAFLVTRVPAHALVDRSIDLQFEGLAPETPAQCIATLQRFLLDRLRDARVHPLVAAALREISQHGGQLSVADVASRCGVTARHLHRLMRRWVGYGPKRYASVVRFQATLGQMEQVPARSAAALAADGGYFDQAHLTIDVGRFAGVTPGGLRSHGVSDFSKTHCDDLP